jgi:protein-disulfide isomerase
MLDQQLLPKYGAKVAFIHRDFPLAKHAWARHAAIASRYIQRVNEEKASQFRRETMAALRTITAESFQEWLKTFCAKNGLDRDQTLASLTDPALAALVQQDFEEGVARGIARTPTALVNGEPFIETFTVEQISAAIDAALKENGIQ